MFSRRRTHTASSHHHHHHHHHRHRHHDPPRQSDSPQNRHDIPKEDSHHDMLLDRIQIDLLDVDAPATGRPHIRIGARKSSKLQNIASFLRRRFDQGAEAVYPNDNIEFFNEQEQLHGDEIPRGVSVLWYRVLDPQDYGSFTVTWEKPHQSVHLCQPELDEVSQDVRSGATLGRLRRKVASFLSGHNRGRTVIHPDQVVIEALGGFRPGPLQGDNWKCSNIEAWVCRHLAISLVPPADLFVFCGFNERYILHKPSLSSDGTTSGRCLKIWLKDKVLTTICQATSRLGGIETENISLYHRRRPVSDGTRSHAGVTFEFQLSRDAGSAFVQAESWLLPLTEVCTICADDKRVSEMPTRGRITENCEHKATACKECVGQWIASSMETISWDRLKCPECPKILGFKHIETFASRDVFNRYDRLTTKAVLEGIKGFRWCLNPDCDSGQIYPSNCDKARCHACKRSSCVRHNVPWHNRETCEEYDKRTRKQRKSYKLSEKHVKKTTKPCPGCGKSINKYSGCDHITCICGHEWCWLCSATYTRDNQSFLECKHAPKCRYHAAPPFWEGRRALLPFLGPGGRQPREAREVPMPMPMIQREGTPFNPFRMAGVGAEAGQRAEAQIEARADRPRQDRPESPEPRPPVFPANLVDFLIDRPGLVEDPRPRRNGMPFMNEALLFDLAQLIERAR
ncbi:hypothetical protein F5Y07DRAFT_406099 [Xylaria sp. FL0933]|nr:hypothetical protein F5Y07DRAFT_406099 [Xylaria sp. FL0933]